MNRISESELILPALFVIDRDGGTATTSQLIYELTNLLNPTGKDVEILSGRTDTKFSQKVRNLKSHNTLEARSFATHKKGRFAITQKEVDELRRHRLDLEPLFEFQLDSAAAELSQLAVGTRLHVIDERVVTEGELRWRSVEYQTRSKELRRSAVDHYSRDGHICCEACDFEFARAYPSIGSGYIQIHHLKPVSFLKGEPLKFEEALSNVRPLCANFHQMVHHKRPPIPIKELHAILKVRYIYEEET